MFKELFTESTIKVGNKYKTRGGGEVEVIKVTPKHITVKTINDKSVIGGSANYTVKRDGIVNFGSKSNDDVMFKELFTEMNPDWERSRSVSKMDVIRGKKYDIYYELSGDDSFIEVLDAKTMDPVIDYYEGPEKEVKKILKKYKGK